jgi:hypothetical protein
MKKILLALCLLLVVGCGNSVEIVSRVQNPTSGSVALKVTKDVEANFYGSKIKLKAGDVLTSNYKIKRGK